MIKKIIAIILSGLIVLIPKMIHADEGRVTSLRQGVKAPYSGILLDDLGYAKIVTEKRYQEREYQLKLDKEIGKLKLEYQQKIDKLEINLQMAEKTYKQIGSLKDTEINRLRKIAGEGTDWTPFWFVGGILIGAAATIGIAFAIKEAK